jgi:hypothetical protein
VQQVWRQNYPCTIDTLRSRIQRHQPLDCWPSSQHTKLCTYANQSDIAFPSRPESTVASISSDALPKHAAKPSPRRERRSRPFESRHQTPPLQRRQPPTYHPPCHASTLRSCLCWHASWPRHTVPLRSDCPCSSSDVRSSTRGNDSTASS